jgi:type IV secretion system protein VirB8
MDSEIATLTFVYKANLKMDDQYRIENPLGFQVTDYRVDADASVAPPEAVPGALLTAPLAQPGAATSPAPASTSAIPASSVISQPPIPEHEATPSAAAPAAAPATNNISNGVGHR